MTSHFFSVPSSSFVPSFRSRIDGNENSDAVLMAYPLLGGLQLEDGVAEPSTDMPCDIWQDLPPDVLKKLLLLLPIKSICRLRAVSRAWRDLLSSAEFFQWKEKVAPLSPLICSLKRGETRWGHEGDPPRNCIPVNAPKTCQSVLSFITKDPESLSTIPVGKRKKYMHWTLDERVDCGDGLVCLRPRQLPKVSRYLMVVNPATSTFRLLPRVPSARYTRCELKIAHLKVDEAFGTTFTLTWYGEVEGTSRGAYCAMWAMGIYSSRTNSWTVHEDSRYRWLCAYEPCPPHPSPHSIVCDGLLFRLERSTSERDGRYMCVCYRYNLQMREFEKIGKAPSPHMVNRAVQGGDRSVAKGLRFVEHSRILYLVAPALLRANLDGRRRLYGYGIWKLEPSFSEPDLVTMTPVVKIEQLVNIPKVAGDEAICVLRLHRVSAVGDFITLEIGTHLERNPDPELHDNERNSYTHVIAFHVHNQSWHFLYVETDDGWMVRRCGYHRLSSSSNNTGESAHPKLLVGKTFLPTFPLMQPNYYFSL